MEALSSALITLATATWVGAILFQSAVVAPAVFAELDGDSARRFLRALFPRFYRLGLVCGALMAAGIVTLVGSTGWSRPLVLLALATSAMILLQALSLWMVPHISAARDAEAAARFGRLHRLTVLLTVVVLLFGLCILGVIGASTTWVA